MSGWGKAFNIGFDPMGLAGVDDSTADEGLFGLLGPGKKKPPVPNMNAGLYGGTPEQSQAYQNQWNQGIQSGAGQVDTGVGMLGQSSQMGQGLYGGGGGAAALGLGAFNRGLGDASQARRQQQQALGMQRDAALGLAPSQAQLLLQGAQDQQARQMMAQASAARGGNQAAAIAAAQGQAAAGNAQTMQQMGALRAQEMAAARGAYGDLSGAMRGQDLGYAGLGGQMTGTGFNAQQAGMQGVGQAGAQTAGIGQQREGNYLGTLGNQLQNEAGSRVDLEMARLNAEQAARAAEAAKKGAIVGAIGSVVGGIYGGGAGAKAGGTAGSAMAGG